MRENDDRNSFSRKSPGELANQKRSMWLLRILLVVAGTGVSLIGAVFIALTMALTKKESPFPGAELYVGFVFLLGGLTLCTWGRRRATAQLKDINAELATRSKRQKSL